MEFQYLELEQYDQTESYIFDSFILFVVDLCQI